uniref:Ribosomal protein S4 n=1 Tax=Pleurosigma inscriptura TaxID=2819025 RepID=A0A8A3SNP0_9STRA|nr:ribosomal protein S4 [Pleurosigma inscriptura]QSZ78234.1 ribosomal protein S4 [Pleurosigma inscriptura]
MNKQRHKPIYKKFINLRSNILNNKKIFNFKKQKWNVFLFHLVKNSKRYRHKPYSLGNFYIPRFASSGNSFKKQFRTNSQNKKKLNIFYGGLLKKKLKKQIRLILYSKQNKDFNSSLIELFESRLDSVLFRSYFSSSLRNSGQMISHGYVTVNNKIVKDKSYLLKPGDLIGINPKYFHVIQKKLKKLLFESRLDSVLFRSYFSSNLKNSRQMIDNEYIMVNNKIVKDKSYLLKPGDLISINPKYHNITPKKFKKLKNLSFWSNHSWFWSVPPSYLVLKYKTMQIVFGDNTDFNFSSCFPFLLDTNAILKSYKR